MRIIYEPRGRAREYAPLSCNLYSGCEHRCKYCYAPAVARKTREAFCQNVMPRKNVVSLLAKDCAELAACGKKVPPVLFCFMCDPYTPVEKHYGVTREAIKAMKAHGLRVEILTKNGALARRDFDLLDGRDAHAATLTFLSEKDSLEWEPGALLPQGRIDALREAKFRGIRTWASLEPVIDPEQSLEIIRQTYSFVDKFKVGKINHVNVDVDWAKFGFEAKALLENLGCDYYLKKDLVSYMDAKQAC